MKFSTILKSEPRTTTAFEASTMSSPFKVQCLDQLNQSKRWCFILEYKLFDNDLLPKFQRLQYNGLLMVTVIWAAYPYVTYANDAQPAGRIQPRACLSGLRSRL